MTDDSGGQKAGRFALSGPICETFAIVALCPILLAVAFWNHFPIFFYDTSAYLIAGLNHQFIIERSPVYSLFLWATGTTVSFWLPVIAQALMTAFVMVQFARAETPSMPVVAFLGFCILIVIGTGLPWYVGQIMPDAFTALAAISIYLAAFRFHHLGLWRALALLLVGGISVGAHPSHLGLSAGLVIAIAALRLASIAWPKLPRPRIKLPIGIFILGVSLVLAGNWYLAGAPFVSRAGGVFVFARLVQDGIVKRLMDETCPQSGYAHCAYKNKLDRTADQYLWDIDSPFRPLGRFKGIAEESAAIVKDSFIRYPQAHLAAAARATGLQLLAFKTGDQIEPQQWILYPDIRKLTPHELPDYMGARQQKGEIDFKTINLLHVPVAILSFAAVLFLLWRAARRRDWESTILPAFVLLTLLGNAIVCGTFANPHDRYQSRIVWIFTLSAGLIFLRGWNPHAVLMSLRSRNWR